MIKSIDIENFRCFEQTTISGFSRVNLISGLNNSGKTALLETLYLNNSPRANSIMLLRRFRRESDNFSKNLPEKTWDNFFFNQHSNKKAIITSQYDDKTPHQIILSCDDSFESFSDFESDEKEDEDFVDFRTLLSTREATRSTLRLASCTEEKETSLSSMIAHSKGIISRDKNLPDVKKVNFIPAMFRSSSSKLAEEYDKAYLAGYANEVLTIIQIIDASIKEAKTLTIGESSLYLGQNNQKLLPISMFGEAVGKVTDFILRLVNNRNSVLLIDEIENGLHHTKQRELWQMLFKLAVKLDVQVFATTHSLEMIHAFRDVALAEEFEGLGAYFELARHVKTGRIVGLNHKLSTLDYELEQHKAVRGE